MRSGTCWSTRIFHPYGHNYRSAGRFSVFFRAVGVRKWTASALSRLGHIHWRTHGAKKRQQAARASSRQAASSGHWSRGQHHGAGATGSCSMWTQARAPRPHRTCLCEIPRGIGTATSRYPPMRPRNKCALVRAGAHVFFTHMATTTDPLVGFRCSFVLWASGSGLQARCRDWAVDWPTHGARKRQQAATAKQQARQQAADTAAKAL